MSGYGPPKQPADIARNAPVFLLMLIYVLIIAYPLLWMVMNSFKSTPEIFANPWSPPSVWLAQNYAEAWQRGISDYFLNSVVVTAATTLLTVLFAALCAYAMVRVPGRIANIILVMVMAGLVIAPQVSLIPLYRLLDAVGLIDTHFAMILPYVAFRLPMAVLLIRSVFVGVSKDLVDAAELDGCNSLQIFWHVYIAMGRTVLMTASVVTAYFAWNEFLFAIVYVNSDSVRTIPAGLMSFRDSLSTDWGVLLAGLVISAIPIVLLFVFLQRYFVAGIGAGSVKG